MLIQLLCINHTHIKLCNIEFGILITKIMFSLKFQRILRHLEILVEIFFTWNSNLCGTWAGEKKQQTKSARVFTRTVHIGWITQQKFGIFFQPFYLKQLWFALKQILFSEINRIGMKIRFIDSFVFFGVSLLSTLKCSFIQLLWLFLVPFLFSFFFSIIISSFVSILLELHSAHWRCAF